MSFVPPFRIITSEDGHYLGYLICSCSYDQWFSNDWNPDCLVHSRTDEEQVQAVAEQARGIDVDKAVIEALHR